MDLKISVCALAMLALAVPRGGAQAQSVVVPGIGDALPEPLYTMEFDLFTQTNPNTIFTYTLSNSALATFISSTQYDFAAIEMPLTTFNLESYTRSAANGALIQIPMFGLAITVPFNNTGIQTLTLNDNQLCGVLSARITNWHQLAPKAPSGTIQVIYRSDSSSTTFLLTQRLNAVCTTANSSFSTYPVPITSVFAQLFPGDQPPPNFTGAAGSQAGATDLLNTPLSLGYLTPDYTSIAPNSSNTTSLKVAALTNPNNGIAYLPTVTNTAVALANPGPGSADPTPPATKAAAANQLNWGPTDPDPLKGYPLVGYSGWLLVTCYPSAAQGKNIIAFLKDYYLDNPYVTVRTNNGFASVPSDWSAAVSNVFLSNKSGYNLNIDNTTACAGHI